jgi:hypothetical protein
MANISLPSLVQRSDQNPWTSISPTPPSIITSSSAYLPMLLLQSLFVVILDQF